MSYDLKADEITLSGGGNISCTGEPGSEGPNGEALLGASCSGIVFSTGDRHSYGTIHPPRERPPDCEDGEEYILDDRVCVSCEAGRYKLTSVSSVCLPCLAGRFATGRGNSECSICPSGYKSQTLASNCTICNAGYFSGKGSDACIACEAGQYSGQNGSSQCNKCDAGQFSSFASGSCSLCAPGNISSQGSSVCTPCAPGFFAGSYGQSECVVCRPGSYSQEAAGVCPLCENGRYNPVEGAAACLNCEPGRYSDILGENVSCTPCPRASYSSVSSSTACKACNGSLITPQTGQQFESNCVCPEGQYRPRYDYKGACIACPTGMTCNVGSDMNNYYAMVPLNVAPTDYLKLSEIERADTYGTIPILDEGFMTLPEDPLWVYQCQNQKVCPGGLPNSCGPDLSNIACGVCAPGFHRGVTQCIECSSVETSRLLFPILPLVLGPSLVFFAYVKMQDPIAQWGSAMNGVMFALSSC
jgi:hypothetical protein